MISSCCNERARETINLCVCYDGLVRPARQTTMPRKLVQHHHQIGYWKGQRESRKFQPLTNFGLQLLQFVAAPSGLPDSYKGYMVRVTQLNKKGHSIREG